MKKPLIVRPISYMLQVPCEYSAQTKPSTKVAFLLPVESLNILINPKRLDFSPPILVLFLLLCNKYVQQKPTHPCVGFFSPIPNPVGFVSEPAGFLSPLIKPF